MLDLEKIAPKLKGITSMSVKDVVTSLVDDGMVDTDKIGTSVYFWAFPSKASANRKRKLDTLQEQLNTVSISSYFFIIPNFYLQSVQRTLQNSDLRPGYFIFLNTLLKIIQNNRH